MNHRRTDRRIFKNSVKLRRNQTKAEVRLWQALRTHRLNGVHFRRQHAIGSYIVDFCAPHRKIVIELDGSQHLEQQEYDAESTAYLEAKGYRVLRFWNHEVMQHLDEVLQRILECV